jgi:hypothetical protein
MTNNLLKKYLLNTILVFICIILFLFLVHTPNMPAPLESNRIYNSHGFSIIAPSNWEKKTFISDVPEDLRRASITIRSHDRSQTITVEAFMVNKPMLPPFNPNSSDAWKEKTIVIQNCSIIAYQYFKKGVLLDSPSQSRMYCYFKSGKYWYEIGYHAEGKNYIPNWVDSYFQTFQIAVDGKN